MIPKIVIKEIIDNPNGGVNLIFDLTEEEAEQVRTLLGWEEFTEEKFNEFVIQALEAMLEETATKNNLETKPIVEAYKP